MTIASRMAEMTHGKSMGMKAMPNGPAMKKEPGDTTAGGPMAASSSSTTLHDHGDGTFHTEGHDGEETQHEHIGGALMHMAAKHSDGKHMHVHHDGVGMKSHHVDEGGQVQGPHDHENIEALKDHMGKFLNEEEQEGGSGGSHDSLY